MPAAACPLIHAQGSRSTGTMSMKFIRNTRQKIVIDSGAISLLRPWNVSRTRPSTNVTTISTTVWNLPGTPAVDLRALRTKKNTNSSDSTAVKISVSTLSFMNAPSPTLTCQKCRWWLMYSVEPPDAGSVMPLLSALIRSTGARAGPVRCHQIRQRADRQSRERRQRRQAPYDQHEREHHDHQHPFRHYAEQQPGERHRCALDATRQRDRNRRGVSSRHGGAAQGGCQRMPVIQHEEHDCHDRGREHLDNHRARCCAATCGDGIVHARLVSCGIRGRGARDSLMSAFKPALRSRKSIAATHFPGNRPELAMNGLADFLSRCVAVSELSKTGRVSPTWPAPYFLVGREAGPPEAPTARPGLRLFAATQGRPRAAVDLSDSTTPRQSGRRPCPLTPSSGCRGR